MKLNTNSNIYTFVYMTVVVIIVAVLLALANQALKPLQEANIQLDKQKQILGALKVDFANGNPEQIYQELVMDTIRIANPKDAAKDSLEIYRFSIEGDIKYVLPLSGKGLWGGIGGYLAPNADKNTIYGVNFNHEGETPGLGAKIVEIEFREKFENKKIFKDNQLVSVAVLKKGKTCAAGEEYQVDAISGATITSAGVSTMLETNLAEYAAFLNDRPAEQVIVEPIKEEEE